MEGAGQGGARQAHGYHRLRVKAVVTETEDAASFVLEVPPELADAFRYRAGQFCTFRVGIDGEEHLRSYSMSSAPETDADLTLTVKRVPGGLVSNWLLDHVSTGSDIETTRPAGVFCLAEGESPIIAFCGGSGVTPVISLAKSALARTGRSVHIVYANRDSRSVIFESALRDLAGQHPGRLNVHHHLDCETGFLDGPAVAALVDGRTDAEFYICGPGPFMDLVEATLIGLGVPAWRIHIERFASDGSLAPTPAVPPAASSSSVPAGGPVIPESVTIIIRRKRHQIPYQRGDTVLETARRGALQPPFSCESGTCATCMALVRQGEVQMRVNHALTPEEIEEGWVLTCQSLPVSPELTVEYEDL